MICCLSCGSIEIADGSVDDEDPSVTPTEECGLLDAFASPVPRAQLRDEEGAYRLYAGRSFYVDSVHLGMDLYAPEEGTPIYAGVHGEVVFVGPASGYGSRVVVIEARSDPPRLWINGRGEEVEASEVLFLYGHLRPSEVFGDAGGQEGAVARLGVGHCVAPETIIGYIERESNNGDGFEHLHFGFRLQSWAEAQQMQFDTGRSMIAGYDRDGQTVRFYGNPMQVLDLVP